MQDPYAPYCPIEDYPVTFQVGMVGSDGVLLASDKLVVKVPRSAEEVTTKYLTDKITILDHENLAYCWAGDELCESVWRTIREQLKQDPNGNFRDQLVHCAHLQLLQERNREVAPNQPRLKGGVILIAHRTPQSRVELWELDLCHPVTANEIKNKIHSGDRTNSARYIVERYFPDSLLPIERLLPLATHTVLMAGKLHPSGVQGLEIALCRESKFEKPDISEWLHRSEQWDRQIAALFRASTA